MLINSAIDIENDGEIEEVNKSEIGYTIANIIIPAIKGFIIHLNIYLKSIVII